MKKSISIERHREIGAKLREIHEWTQRLLIDEVQPAYGKSSKQVLNLVKLSNRILELRSTMEDGLFKEHPGEATVYVYYGTPK